MLRVALAISLVFMAFAAAMSPMILASWSERRDERKAKRQAKQVGNLTERLPVGTWLRMVREVRTRPH
ncbi:MAG: hypothetical protein A3H72_00050 [Candidatus Doudnabacteria bacterium RIFCSPLOWO2_02_FULL_48_8]|uniref:Uncharacterized protein n=1 Tax=Candidatus Doudnabacteria bacterium RIFCSPHIGHO2_01_FULL_46_24 TaxID=1817825 RepID=A0A1F5NW74_9BACT|nr:MAG: hypothetical protein A2720_01830 [Candidatus Doudnabacteria bacterium RIFCSPHIGHO2_01_FULL_46_24]OGE95205.1 MAG: hypothetical protein A3H72_00050 [Candidatus Doudnabacteria bacterium RIFCSPLOWO2_02_FULL_48_8]OGE95379.1 MAG: hypothetical protein A3E98_00890 [Candidatus Doudnabacteria bacterium RIFCSPHIGHO2_12_FULL_48_11]